LEACLGRQSQAREVLWVEKASVLSMFTDPRVTAP
jgi:hypothetical protein